jgi:hypothetical protein
MDLTAWLGKLLVTAALLAGYSAPDHPPNLRVLPGAELSARVCNGACPARGAYIAGGGVLLSDGLDMDDPMDRSVLVHELVHYLQDLSGRFADEPACKRWRDREAEAYAVQDKYLERYNLGVGPHDAEYSLVKCEPGD